MDTPASQPIPPPVPGPSFDQSHGHGHGHAPNSGQPARPKTCRDLALSGAGCSVLLLIIGLPVVGIFYKSSPSPARRMQDHSQAMARVLSAAVEGYYADYHRLPLPAGPFDTTKDMDADLTTGSGIVRILLAREAGDPAMRNTRRTNYLEGLRAAIANNDPSGPRWRLGLIPEEGNQFTIVDAWGHPWRIRLDTDGDGRVASPDPADARQGQPLIQAPCLIWSPGPDGNDGAWQDNPKSWSVKLPAVNPAG